MTEKGKIVLTIVGLAEDNGDVEFKSFLEQLELVRRAIHETKRIIFNDDENKKIAYFKVTDLSHQSPAKIVLEAVPYSVETTNQTEELVNEFFNSLSEIEQGRLPKRFDFEAIDAFREMSRPVNNKKIDLFTISRNGDVHTNINEFPIKIDAILGPDVLEYGSAKGRLEYLNLHERANIFYIYSTHELPKIKCRFPSKLRADVIKAIDKYVTVYGTKKFKPNIKSYNPYEILVDNVVIHPDVNELPKLIDLFGTAPDATGDKSSEEFVRGIRDEW